MIFGLSGGTRTFSVAKRDRMPGVPAYAKGNNVMCYNIFMKHLKW